MSKRSEDRPDHSGSTAAEDAELTQWLNRLWARNEAPERIELWQMFGRNKVVRGEKIFHEDLKPNEKLTVEHANKMANEILAAAQNDCDSLRRESWYEIAVIDRNRTASPLVRRVGPIQPKRTYALKTLNHVDEESSDEDEVTSASLALRYTKENFEQLNRDKSRNDRLVEGMLFLQHSIIKDQQATIDQMMNKVVAYFDKMQEAEDRRVQRELLIEREKFKLSLMRDGVRTARNLLPGIFAGAGPEPDGGGGGNGASKTSDGATDYGPSPERTLVGNFMHDIEEESEALQIALFGDFENQDGKLVQVKEGIFTFAQFRILMGVRNGRLPPTALDALLPKSGTPTTITQEQITRAIAAGVTEGMGMALMEVVGLRQRAKENAAALNGGQPSAE